MRGASKNTSNAFTKLKILNSGQQVATGGTTTHGGGLGGAYNKNGDMRWVNTSQVGSNSFYEGFGTSLVRVGNSAQAFGPTVTLSSIDPNQGSNGDVDVYLYGTNLDITTAVAFKKSGVTYTSAYIAWDADLLGTPPAPNLYVEIPASLTSAGVYSIVITNSYGSTEFPAMFTYTL